MSETVNIDEVEIVKKNLMVPPLAELQNILSKGLKTNFEQVTVDIMECPNLKKSPYNLIESGMGGSPTIIVLGGVDHIVPIPDKSKIYNINDIINNSMDKKNTKFFIIGCGAGPFTILNKGCEGMYNMIVKHGGFSVNNKGYIAHINGEHCVLAKIPSKEKKLTLHANLFVSEGITDAVLRIYCKKRIGKISFTRCLQSILSNSYQDRTVGIGGLFQIKEGITLHHVMRDFLRYPIITDNDLKNWLKFYEMPAELISLGTIISYDEKEEEESRLQHFHSFSNKNWGGHYHTDTTPNDIVYEGIFKVAEKIVYIDKPKSDIALKRNI